MHSRKKRADRWSVHNERDIENMFNGPGRGHNKTARLCRQIERAISQALACGESPLLRELSVLSVEPLRGAASVRVTVTMDGDEYSFDEARAVLARANAYIRSEVAREVNRKRTPTLVFHLAPPPPAGPPPPAPEDGGLQEGARRDGDDEADSDRADKDNGDGAAETSAAGEDSEPAFDDRIGDDSDADRKRRRVDGE